MPKIKLAAGEADVRGQCAGHDRSRSSSGPSSLPSFSMPCATCGTSATNSVTSMSTYMFAPAATAAATSKATIARWPHEHLMGFNCHHSDDHLLDHFLPRFLSGSRLSPPDSATCCDRQPARRERPSKSFPRVKGNARSAGRQFLKACAAVQVAMRSG